MQNIFRASKPNAQIPHNGFDKSRRDVFSTKVGLLTPCFVEDVYPDSKFQVDNVNIVRVDSIQSAPFVRMSQNIEYFYVPYSQIWHDFERFYYERGDHQRNNANVLNVGQSSKVPTFNLRDFVEYCYLQYCALRVYRIVRDSAISEASTSPALESFLPFILEQLDSYFHRFTSNFAFGHFSADLKMLVDVHNRFCIEDVLRNFDMLGYGNYLPALKSFFAVTYRLDDIYTAVDTLCNYFHSADLPTFSVFSNSFSNILGYFYQPQLQELQGFVVYTRNLNREVSIFRAAAYLKVWADYYRNSQYDVDVNYAYYFNYDYVVTDAASKINVAKVAYCLLPRYRQWKKDVFTGSFPTAQFGSVAVALTNNPVSIVNTNPVSGTGANSASVLQSGSVDPGALIVYEASRSKWNIDSSVSALSIRQAMALQKYKERILRAGNRLPNLQRAVFGDNSRYIEDEYVDFIGASHSSIDINSVASTAEIGTQNVGDLSSNGISTFGGNVFQYHVHDFGVIIGLFYVLPESEYENFGLDRMVTLTESYDFYKPDFANLGLSPVFNFDFNIQQYYLGSEQSLVDSVIGYLARYWQYKATVDKVHGEFYSQTPIGLDESLIQSEQSSVDLTDYNSSKMGAFAQFVTPRDSYDTLSPRLSALYCSPNSVDRIFYASSDEFQSSDQFKINMSHQVKAILPMSVIGLPQ